HVPAASITATQFVHEWADRLHGQGWDMVDASRGRPSLPYGDAGQRALQDYIATLEAVRLAPYGTDTLGEPAYRQEVARAFARDYGTEVDWRNIAFTTGGQFGLALTFYTLLKANPEGMILAPCPWYLNHHELAKMALHMLGQPERDIFLPLPLLHSDGAYLDPDDITALQERAPSVAAILLCQPGNPAGNVFSADDKQALTTLLDAFPDAPVMLDEAFFETAFDPVSFTEQHLYPSIKERCFLFRSGTKALGFAGERLAVMAIPPAYLEEFTWLQSRWMGNPPLSSQAILSAILASLSMQDRQSIADYYSQNASLLYDALKALGLDCIPVPQGGFFTLMDASKLLGQPIPEKAIQAFGFSHTVMSNDLDIAMSVLAGYGQAANQGLATMPASCFGIAPEKGWLRVSFSITRDELHTLIARLQAIFG
ncbi:MAG: hypothetical protein CMM93_00445, partial [Rickettsiales bacterium]|nr:hypothetical protein [Rickettsiales bacterium]